MPSGLSFFCCSSGACDKRLPLFLDKLGVWHKRLYNVLMKSSPENIDYVLYLAYLQPKGDCEKRYCRKCNRDE